MGQRLIISINRGAKELAKLYYHWSAYTFCALKQTQEVVDCIYNHKDETDEQMLLRLIRFCEEQGGGIKNGHGSEEWKYICKLYPNEKFDHDDISRNNGLIALSEEGMKDLQDWSEGDVYIDLDTDRIDFCVYCGYVNLDEYIESRSEWDEDFEAIELDDMPEYDFNLGCFDVSDIDYIVHKVEITNAGVINCGGEICELVE